MKVWSQAVVASLVIASCSGCTHKYYKDSERAIHSTEDTIQAIKSQAATVQPAVIVKSGFYIDSRPVELNNQPVWMKDHLSIRGEGIPLRELVARVIGSHKVSISYDSSVDTARLVTIDYNGTLAGALKTVASTLNYHYSVVGKNEISWSAFENKTFSIAFMPGVSNYMVGESSSTSGSTSSAAGAGGTPTLQDQQFNNLSARLSVWQDVTKALDQLKSTEGTINVSQATTSVAVHDRPRAVRAIGHYIKNLNKVLSKEVLIKVQLIEVQMNRDFNFGIDWNVLAHTLGTNFTLSGNMQSASNIVKNNLILSSSSSSTVGSFGIGSSTQSFIKSLGEQGRVRVLTEPQVTTINNQMGSIRITKNTGYIQSISQTMNDTFTSTSIVPGNIVDGLTLYVLPKIQGDKVFLQLSSTVAHLDRLEKISSQPDGITSTSTTGPTYQAIQLPTVSQKSFNQRSFVRSGSTLIMAGYKRLEDQTQEASFLGVKELGGKGSISQNVETLLLITPIIIESPESNVHINPQ